MQEQGSQPSAFNMSVPTLDRIDELLKALNYISVHQYLNGKPLQYQNLRTLLTIYDEVRPFVSQDEIDEVEEDFLGVFEEHPIKLRRKSLWLPESTEKAMREFNWWLRDRLLKYKLLMGMGENPEDALK